MAHMSDQARKGIAMATVHRTGDVGLDLPAGASADDLEPADYHPVEMVDEGIAWAVVHRPNDVGIDLPAGASASQLSPTDDRIVEVDGAPRPA